jgi:acyl-CoA synthetase (AMP-forming)/AMP-acid ligase II
VFYSTTQLADQLSFVRCKALFTCTPLLDSALEAAAAAGIPRQHVYVLDVPEHLLNGKTKPLDIKSVDQLIQEGSILPNLPSLKWEKGQGARQTAFLITSSGTSGLPVSTD